MIGKLFFLCIICYLLLWNADGFNFRNVGFRLSSSKTSLGMAKAQLSEVRTKRLTFMKWKMTYLAALKHPRHWKTVQRPLEMELYTKCHRNISEHGNCPFTQFLQIIFLKKGITHKLIPTLPSNIPEWIRQEHHGQLPALFNLINNETVGDPINIAEYLEDLYPEVPLIQNSTATYNKFKNFYPALRACILNKDPEKENSLLTAVTDYLDVMEAILKSSPGKFLCGLQMTAADLYVAPLLFHAMVSLEAFKNYEILHLDSPPTRPILEKYMSDMFFLKEMNDDQVYCPPDKIIYGWQVEREETPPPQEFVETPRIDSNSIVDL